MHTLPVVPTSVMLLLRFPNSHPANPLSLYKICCTISSIFETSGIYSKRPTVRTDLPSRSYDNMSLSSGLSKFPVDSNVNRLILCVDAAHANSLVDRRSTIGVAFACNSGAIDCKSTNQTFASIETEFIAAVAIVPALISLPTCL